MPFTHGNELTGPEREGGARFGVVKATYDPAVNGGSVAAHGLGVYVPDGAIVYGGLLFIDTAFTSTGDNGTIAISLEGANDILSAVDADTLATGEDLVPDGTGSTAVPVTGETEIVVTVATNAILTGAATLYLFYVAP